MTNTIAKGLTLFAMCLTHTAGLGFATYGSDTPTVAHCDDFGSVIALTESSGGIPAAIFTAAYILHGEDWGATDTTTNNLTHDPADRLTCDNITSGPIPRPTLQRTASNTFDTLNRPTNSIAIPNSSPLIPNSVGTTNRFAYDAVGNMTLASNATATLTFAYDAMNRLTSAVTKAGAPTFTTRWQRDPAGLVTNLTYATGKSVTYTHDADGLLASVKDWQGNQWTFTRDATGRLTAMSSPDGTVSGYAYDNAGRLASWNTGTLASRTITYDAAGKRIRDDITAGAIPKPTLQRTALNTFDAADRLISASARYGQGADSTEHITETFSYDDNGAMTNWISSTNLPFTVHDLSLSYDALGQVASVSDDHQFSYDAFGNRLKTKTQQLGTILWIPNHSDPLKRPLMECDASGNVIRYYIWGGNILLGYVDGVSGELTVGHADETGSVIALTDSTGNLLHTAAYGPHGEDWGSTGVNPTPFAWLGGHGVRLVDDGTPLRLYITRHRVYSATLNRFLSPDPLGLSGGLNLYEYGYGNPLVYIDPEGLCGSENRLECNMPGYGAPQSYQIIGGNVRNLTVSDLSVAGSIAFNGLYFMGETSSAGDIMTLFDPGAGVGWKAAATISLGLDVLVVGLVPGTSTGTARVGVKALDTVQIGTKPVSLTPVGAGRTGALHEALRQNGVPTSQQPSRVTVNVDNNGKVQMGRNYEYTVQTSEGPKTVIIRDDAAGHYFGPGDPQNRGPHFNDPLKNHYDY